MQPRKQSCSKILLTFKLSKSPPNLDSFIKQHPQCPYCQATWNRFNNFNNLIHDVTCPKCDYRLHWYKLIYGNHYYRNWWSLELYYRGVSIFNNIDNRTMISSHYPNSLLTQPCPLVGNRYQLQDCLNLASSVVCVLQRRNKKLTG